MPSWHDAAAWAERTLRAWPLLAVLVLGMVLSWVLVNGRWLFPGTRILRRGVWCPACGRDAGVEFRVATWDGHVVDVTRCSALDPAHLVRCDKRCLAVNLSPRGGRTGT